MRAAAAIPQGRTHHVIREEYEPVVIWFTGLPGAGKTTLARAMQKKLRESGRMALLLDGDQLRSGVCADLGFSPADRHENIRRAGQMARLLFEQGAIVLCAFVSPYRDDRSHVRSLLPAGRFVEVFVNADVETCRARDPKGLYARARAGGLDQLTGVSAPYEAPVAPELVVDTTNATVEDTAARLMAFLEAGGFVGTVHGLS
jgi:bifunctional enzyme CysN/CysC